MAKYLVTSALIYANGPVHLGHVAGAYLPADVFVRSRRLNGDDVLFISGSDEHGVPITLKAEKEGVSPQEIAQRYHKMTDEAFQGLMIHFDNYSGTSMRPVHTELSQRFFKNLMEGGHIETKVDKQFFDEKDQRFLPDRYVEGTCPKCGYEKARGDQCDNCGSMLNSLELIHPKSALSGETPVVKETMHWYLKLQDFEKQLVDWLEKNTHWKDNVRNFILGWIKKEGLHERSVTRDMKWGIPVPVEGAEGKVLYVWFDAPIGYISSTIEWAQKNGKGDAWKDYWMNEDVKMLHFIGKDNIPFHTIIWPAMLMGQKENYNLPYDVPANEYLNLEGRKLSTSQNWAVWAHEYLQDFPACPLRYYLASNAPETKDADFTWKGFQAKNNDELANIYGNFANRTLTFLQKYADGIVPTAETYSKRDKETFAELEELVKRINESYLNFRVRMASKLMMDIARVGNRYFDEMAPWKLRKDDPKRLEVVLNVCMNILRMLAVSSYPIIPTSAEKLWKQIGESGKITDERWEDLAVKSIHPGQKTGEIEILFVKYEDDVIQAQVDKLIKGSAPKEEEKLEELNIVSIDDVFKLDLRVAEILEAEEVPKSKKLIKLQVRVGEEKRQILAGIKLHYSPEELVGKKIVIVNNLKPAKLMGMESQGMLLAASNADKSELSLIGFDKEVESGWKVS